MIRFIRLAFVASAVLTVMPRHDCVAADLADRYEKLSRAVVRIETLSGSGTGFFINGTGRLVTAAHVVFGRTFTGAAATPILKLAPFRPANVVFYDGKKLEIPSLALTSRDNSDALFDLAVLDTGFPTPDFIPIGHSDAAKVGNHVISIGFPASANSGVLYEGFVSSKHNHVPTVIGPLEGTDQSLSMWRDIMRVQMPVTAGASGSPLIDDHDEAIGVISEIPVQWSSELSRLALTASNSPGGSGIVISGFDTTKLLGDLALIVKEFESPGAGIAVPVIYLKVEPDAPELPNSKPK
jgi:S1-C subfamily serine protease